MLFTYQAEVERGMVSKRHHPENHDVVILNYSDLAVYERNWNEVTLSCRGLIINEKTNEILARPFLKFFNFGEECGLELKIPKGEPTVAIKYDGSLGISYFMNGELRWATRGSFVSDQSQIAQNIWNTKYSHIDLNKLEGITLLAEIIDENTRVVVDYEGVSDLVLLGAIRIADGYDFTYDELIVFANKLGMNLGSNTGLSLESALEKKQELGYNEEGYVLRWGDGYNAFRLKVKGNRYLEVHRMLYGLSLRKKVESWMTGSLEELIKQVPEEFRPEIESFRDKLNGIESVIAEEVINFVSESSNKNLKDRKDFAQYFIHNGNKKYLSFYFNLLDGKKPNIKEYIYKNYLDLLNEDDV